MRRILGRLLILGAAAGAAYVLRNYLEGSRGSKKGDVQIVLDNGTTIDLDPADSQEFADIARKILEVGG